LLVFRDDGLHAAVALGAFAACLAALTIESVRLTTYSSVNFHTFAAAREESADDGAGEGQLNCSGGDEALVGAGGTAVRESLVLGRTPLTR
jgi:hypothetical protein